MEINTKEAFEHLGHAPIIEAVIDIRCVPQNDWREEPVKDGLSKVLLDYSQMETQVQGKISLGPLPGALAQGSGGTATIDWEGYRLRSSTAPQLCQFTRGGFLFSRLSPYSNWAEFSKEALRLWEVHRSIARPASIQRVGVRFINRILTPAEGLRTEDAYTSSPTAPKGLEVLLAGFLSHETWKVPGHNYGLNLIKTIQSVPGQSPTNVGLFVDVDVFTAEDQIPVEDNGVLARRLDEMHWLKNKAFFGSITSSQKERLR